LLILEEVWEFLGELVERGNEFCDLLLFVARSLQELDELPLTLVQAVDHRFILLLDLAQSKHAVADVGHLHVFPEFNLVLACVNNFLLFSDRRATLGEL
jgi:hypothetical protein